MGAWPHVYTTLWNISILHQTQNSKPVGCATAAAHFTLRHAGGARVRHPPVENVKIKINVLVHEI